MRGTLIGLAESWKAQGEKMFAYRFFAGMLESMVDWPVGVQYLGLEALRVTILHAQKVLQERGLLDVGNYLVKVEEAVKQTCVVSYEGMVADIQAVLDTESGARCGVGTCQLCGREFTRHRPGQETCSGCWIKTHTAEIWRDPPVKKGLQSPV